MRKAVWTRNRKRSQPTKAAARSAANGDRDSRQYLRWSEAEAHEDDRQNIGAEPKKADWPNVR